MVRIRHNTIVITRGDTLDTDLTIRMENWRRYEPSKGDRIIFALKSEICDPEPFLVKEIPIGTMNLRLEADETERIPARSRPYIYDVELRSFNDSIVATVIAGGEMYVNEEVR